MDSRPKIEEYWAGAKSSEDADDALGALCCAVALLDEVTQLRNTLVERALATGKTWDDIADALGLANGQEAYIMLGDLET